MLSDAVQITHPLVSEVIKKDFYVDDLLTGADSFETIAKKQEDISQLLSPAGFKLEKWFSNHPDLRISDDSCKPIMVDESSSTRILGICWRPREDIFQFKVEDNFMGSRNHR